MTVLAVPTAYGMSTVWWAALSAVAAVAAGTLAVKTKLGFGWLTRRTKKAYLEWHAEGVETYIEPKLAQLRSEIVETATATQRTTIDRAGELSAQTIAQVERVHAETLVAAETVREALEASERRQSEQLERHTSEEGDLVRGVVREELAPILLSIETRDARFDRVERKLDATHEMVTTHMTHDERIVVMAADALNDGQQALIDRMDRQHAETLALIHGKDA